VSKAGQTVRPMMMATPASTISRAATRSQQRKPLAALLLGFSLPRRPYQDMTKISTHKRDEQGRDSRVIGFVRSDVEFHEG
jgi:hypothetical protein